MAIGVSSFINTVSKKVGILLFLGTKKAPRRCIAALFCVLFQCKKGAVECQVIHVRKHGCVTFVFAKCLHARRKGRTDIVKADGVEVAVIEVYVMDMVIGAAAHDGHADRKGMDAAEIQMSNTCAKIVFFNFQAQGRIIDAIHGDV